jgi:hypothetical protein
MSTKVNPPTPGVKPAAPMQPMPGQPIAGQPMRTANPMQPTTSAATMNNPTFCVTPTQQQIAQRAYERWVKRGRPHGTHLQDWLEAEMELKREMAAKAGQKPC